MVGNVCSRALLFSIYINDLPNCSVVFKMIMYADDTTLYCDLNPGTPSVVNIINGELSKQIVSQC